MTEAVLIALIGSGGLVAVAAIAAWADLRQNTLKVQTELEGNGRGTMLEMITDLHKESGANGARLDSLEERMDRQEDSATRRW